MNGKILFTLSYVKYVQLDFSLLVNWKYIERKVFPSNYKNFRQVDFNLEPEVKGTFLFKSYNFFFLLYDGVGEGKY